MPDDEYAKCTWRCQQDKDLIDRQCMHVTTAMKAACLPFTLGEKRNMAEFACASNIAVDPRYLSGTASPRIPAVSTVPSGGKRYPWAASKRWDHCPKTGVSLKPVLNWANVCPPNILRTVRRTMIRFLIELLVRRTWFGLSKLYFVLNWLVMRCKLRPELAADAQQTA